MITHHGYLMVFGLVLAEAIGLPVPAAVALVAGGAAAAAHFLNLPVVISVAILAMLLGDCLLYILGRHMGWALLGVLCRVSTNPETCILRSAESFYQRGKITLVIAKFIPGVNTMAPPLAGSMKMKFLQFLRLDVAGASLYSLAYIFLGFVFRDFLASLTHGFQLVGRSFEEVLILAVFGYVIYRFWMYRKHRVYRIVPRVQVEELARRLEAGEADKLMIVDVRSHGYYDAGTERIAGSIRIEPNNLNEEVRRLPREKDIYLYCT